jgi:TonB family protein
VRVAIPGAKNGIKALATLNHARTKDSADRSSVATPATVVPLRVPKPAAFLVSPDGALWSEVGALAGDELNLRQTDSIAELCQATAAGQGGIVIWDTREETDRSAEFSRLQQHSSQLATIVVDNSGRSDFWRPLLHQGLIVAQLSLPIAAAPLASALAAARGRLPSPAHPLARSTDQPADEPPPPRSDQRADAKPGTKLPLAAIAAGALAAAAAGYFYWNQQRGEPAPAQAVTPGPSSPRASAAPPSPAAGKTPADAGNTDEKIDLLLERARQAMLDRHYMEPADTSALALYQDVLTYDPGNGEARQGLQRIAQILITRVQSNLDEKRFDLALQALETARNITPDDPRIAPLDQRIASLRAELGPAQIQAALNAKNFDKAAQLLDEAARAKILGAASLSQLRDELGRRRADANVANLLKLIEARLQQDRLIDPLEDNAAYYLQKARGAGATPDQVQLFSQELSTRLLAGARTAIEQRRFSTAERQLSEAVNAGAQAGAVTALQRDLAAAQAQQSKDKADQNSLLELAQSRLAQGTLLEPEGDNAWFYLNQLRTTNPKNAGLAALASGLQAQLAARARAALDAGNPSVAEPLLARAAELGPNNEVNDLSARLAQAKQSDKNAAPVPTSAQLVVTTPTRLEYPRAALHQGTEGWVSLSFTVDTTGKVTNIKVLDASPPGVFNDAAVRALSRTRYKPVLNNGTAVEVPARVRLVFKMEGN